MLNQLPNPTTLQLAALLVPAVYLSARLLSFQTLLPALFPGGSSTLHSGSSQACLAGLHAGHIPVPQRCNMEVLYTWRGRRLGNQRSSVSTGMSLRFDRAFLIRHAKAEVIGLIDARPGKSLLIRALREGGLTNIEEMTDSCLTFILAGRDTTADAAAWLLYDLLSNHSYIARLQAEIADLPAKFDRTEILDHLLLLTAIISESLRLHPPVPLEVLECIFSEPIALPDGTIVLLGEQILWQPHTMTLFNPLFGSDPEVLFRPGRWLGIKQTSYEFAVFHSGPRGCLGQKLAEMELAWLFVEILGRSGSEKAWDEERVYGEGLTGDMKGGLPVLIKLRSV